MRLGLSVFLCGMGLLVSGCATPPRNTAFQASTIDALLAGVYDGDMSCEEMLRHGDFGIGTFDQLDGEMLLLDGEVYQIKSDGKVYQPDLSIKTPFATVCQFEADQNVEIYAGADFSAVEALIDQACPNQNLFYAVKMRGHFSVMKTRSVPAQQKPYPSLKEATAHQPEFGLTDISGTIVGFRCPPYVKGINVPGYHFHFLSDDHSHGGHVLSFKMDAGTCQVDMLDRYSLALPSGASEFAGTDLGKDRGADLKQVEAGR